MSNFRSPHYFLALPVPESAANPLAMAQKEMREHLDYKIWPQHEDFHITLKFLGAANQEQLEDLKQRVAGIAGNQCPMDISLSHAGWFGNPKGPRVVFAAVDAPTELWELRDAIEKAAAGSGFEKENRSYTPHITLAKKRAGDHGADPETYIKSINFQPADWTAEQVVLYRINPGKKIKYEPVFICQFSGGQADI